MSARKTSQGFIALTSSIIVGTVLLILVISLAFTSYYSRFSILDAESKEVSQGLAEGCVETVILKYSQGKNSYITSTTFPEEVNIGSETCSIVSVSHSTPFANTQVKASFNKAVTNLEVEFFDTSPFEINSWEEVANF